VCACACCACYINDICVFAGRLAQPNIVFSSKDMHYIQQAMAEHLSAHPAFIRLFNSLLPEDTLMKSELAQLRKHANQGIDLHQP